jgi:hypothetical protein
MQKTNKVVRISYAGGLLGLIFGSARGKLEALLKKHNDDGWNLAEIIPDNPNLLIWILRMVILVLTLGLWTLSNGYLLILEKPVEVSDARFSKKPLLHSEPREPSFSATIKPTRSVSNTLKKDRQPVSTYKGMPIYKSDDGYRTLGLYFESIEDAQQCIDEQG